MLCQLPYAILRLSSVFLPLAAEEAVTYLGAAMSK
jgi:hypothetical protein